MTKTTLTITAIALMVVPMALNAQPPGAGDFPRPEGERFPAAERRFEAAAEYLDLTDGQRVEWEGILDQHRQTARREWQDLAELRQQFRDLAETEKPDLTELGSLALTMHRRTEAMHGRRTELTEELQAILTPDQVERFEALKTARETIRPRGRKGRPQREARPDSGRGTG